MNRRGNGSDSHIPPVRPGDVPPPHSPEAENALLGAILVDPMSISTAAEYCRAEDFFHPANQKIMAVMYGLWERQVGIDPVTVISALRDSGELEGLGGPAYVSGLLTEAGPTTSVEYYASIVRDKAAVRRIIGVASGIVSQGYAPDLDPSEFFDQAEAKLFQAGEVRLRGNAKPLGTALDEAVIRLEQLRALSQHVVGVPTLYHHLDNKLGGFQKSDLIILAARPAMGKTSVALNLALNATTQDPPHGVLFCSLEMNEPQITNRLLALRSGIQMSRLRTGFVSGGEMDDVRRVRDDLRTTPLYIDDSPKLSLMELRAKARRLKTRGHLSMVLIDYLQLMDPSDKKISREQQISEISRGLKALAKELDVPVIALSQLSRAVETRPGKDKRPLLSDLRESGAIEQDADVVLFLYRPEYYDPKDKPVPEHQNLLEIIIAKQRNGPTGIVNLTFIPETMQVADRMEDVRDLD